MSALLCHQIRIDETDICEMAGDRVAASLERAQAQRLRVQYDFVAERPLVQGSIGIALIVVGVYYALSLWHRLQNDMVVSRYEALLVADRATRKLGFGKRATAAEIARFADEAREQGLQIRVETSLR